MMRPLDANVGTWRKFERYEIREGRICPAPGARAIDYDPWELYSEAKRQTNFEPPYLTLFKLLDKLAISESSPLIPSEPEQRVFWRPGSLIGGNAGLPDEKARPLLEWCCQWGLLGILPQAIGSITLHPRPLTGDEWMIEHLQRAPEYLPPSSPPRSARPLIGSDEVVGHYQKIYRRANGVWTSGLIYDVHDGVFPPEHPAYRYMDSPQQPHAIMSHSHFGTYAPNRREKLKESVWLFFPSVCEADAETFSYPLPLTPAFWEEYAEPITDFILFAFFFREAVSGLSPNPPLSSAGFGDAAENIINALLSAAGQSVDCGASTVSINWRFPSLLSSFAMMAVQDLIAGHRIFRCLACGGFLVTSAYQARYCDGRCASRHRQRRARERKRSQDRERTGGSDAEA